MIFNTLLQSMNKSKYRLKIGLLSINVFIFSIIYSLMGSSHFIGLNPLQDKIKDDIVEKEVKDVTDTVTTESFQQIHSYSEYFDGADKDKVEITRDVKNVVKDEEDKLERPSFIQRYIDSFYYSVVIACLLGSGDIHPATNAVKFLVCCQSLITIGLILY